MKIKANVDLGASFERLKGQLDIVKGRTTTNATPEDYARSYGALKSAINLHIRECTEQTAPDPDDIKNVL